MSLDEQVRWLQADVGVCQLGDRSIIEVTGDDARDWLQGQITNQTEGVNAGGSVYGFILTLKGRVLADAWVLAREDEFWLDVPRKQVDALLERLDRYIIMEDVDLAHRSDLQVLTAVGPRAGELDGANWPTDRLGTGGRTWVVTSEEVDRELARLTAAARALGGGEVTSEAWAQAHVVQGRPRFGVDFAEDTYPQETGLTPIAVSFNKGCYIGQETVVMLQNRGKPPKVLWRWALHAEAPPPPHTPILDGDTRVGEITSATSNGAQRVALGFLKRGHEAGADARWTVGGVAAEALGPVEANLGPPQT
ncbi:MAG: hypothetical protein WBG86_22465 [Polyangiales bacterium]